MKIQFDLTPEANKALAIAYKVGASKDLDVRSKAKQVNIALELLCKLVESEVVNINLLSKIK